MNATVAPGIDADLIAAHALVEQDRPAEALPLFERALQTKPDFFVGRLQYARVLELAERNDEALRNYFRALNDAQTKGRWRNEETTAPVIRELVKYAMNYVDAGRERIFGSVLAPFRAANPPEELARVEQCLQIYLGDRVPDYQNSAQRAKFLHFPGLPTSAYFAGALFPWYAELEKNTDIISAELLALLGEKKNFEPFLNIPSPEQVPNYLGGEKPNWDAFFFYRHGRRYDENCAQCPRTTEILESLPLVRIAEHAPEVCFSVLTPGTHILPHHGSTNTRLVTHLPLVVPPDCAIKVGGELHAWEEGRCITFDDTFEHEAWNRSDQTRTVLIMDVWNPYLTDIEKGAVTALIEAIRSFNRSSGVLTD
ncbi:MAG TPA: aspartyl/asparaginyl beta-hydroxylase domain-containing protein [Rudaea sp.]|jgi:aspartate beta-hydroxylase|nr:aspartyl/asparaginyl beta-hydroxylase domain-containing protein [Rudaea sp.]